MSMSTFFFYQPIYSLFHNTINIPNGVKMHIENKLQPTEGSRKMSDND